MFIVKRYRNASKMLPKRAVQKNLRNEEDARRDCPSPNGPTVIRSAPSTRLCYTTRVAHAVHEGSSCTEKSSKILYQKIVSVDLLYLNRLTCRCIVAAQIVWYVCGLGRVGHTLYGPTSRSDMDMVAGCKRRLAQSKSMLNLQVDLAGYLEAG